jgi:hypothetical protein
MPSASELSLLPDPVAAQVLINCDNANRREANFASLSMICGTIGLLGCLGIFAYLVRIDHPKSAAVAIGTGVLAIVGQIVNSRLNKKVS